MKLEVGIDDFMTWNDGDQAETFEEAHQLARALGLSTGSEEIGLSPAIYNLAGTWSLHVKLAASADGVPSTRGSNSDDFTENTDTAWRSLQGPTSGRRYRASERQALFTALKGTAPVMTCSKEGIALTFTVHGTLQSAFSSGIEAVWTAFELADLPGHRIVEAKLVNHASPDPVAALGETPRYYGLTECAMALEVSKQRIEQLVAAGDFLSPDAYVGKRKAWLESTVRRIAANRKKQRGTGAC